MFTLDNYNPWSDLLIYDYDLKKVPAQKKCASARHAACGQFLHLCSKGPRSIEKCNGGKSKVKVGLQRLQKYWKVQWWERERESWTQKAQEVLKRLKDWKDETCYLYYLNVLTSYYSLQLIFNCSPINLSGMSAKLQQSGMSARMRQSGVSVSIDRKGTPESDHYSQEPKWCRDKRRLKPLTNEQVICELL